MKKSAFLSGLLTCAITTGLVIFGNMPTAEASGDYCEPCKNKECEDHATGWRYCYVNQKTRKAECKKKVITNSTYTLCNEKGKAICDGNFISHCNIKKKKCIVTSKGEMKCVDRSPGEGNESAYCSRKKKSQCKGMGKECVMKNGRARCVDDGIKDNMSLKEAKKARAEAKRARDWAKIDYQSTKVKLKAKYNSAKKRALDKYKSTKKKIRVDYAASNKIYKEKKAKYKKCREKDSKKKCAKYRKDYKKARDIRNGHKSEYLKKKKLARRVYNNGKVAAKKRYQEAKAEPRKKYLDAKVKYKKMRDVYRKIKESK